MKFSFDLTEHKGSDGKNTLNGRYIEYKILNSEDEEIVFFSAHPYDANSDNSNLIKIGGTAIDKTKSEILTAFNQRGIGITTSVDYHARKVKITMGSSTFEGAIPASAMKDIAKFEFSVRLTSAVSADRYITLDNLAVNEFTSTEQAASAGEITNGYDEKTYGGVTSRVKAPSDSTDKPLVLFLSSKSRFGTDNEGQLYQAQYFFDQLADNAILAAPQTASAWDEDALEEYIAGAKEEYNPTEVVVIGYDEGATAAYSLSDVADKIIPISGGGNVYGKVKAKYWAFGGFLDDTVSIADIRKPVNALQTAGARVRYTEYPTDKHNILEKVSKETGVIDWIKGDVTDKKVVDLVLFAGQSNMAGRGDYTLATKCPPGAGFEFHSITNPKLLSGEVPYALSTVSEPFGKNDNNSAINDDSREVDRRAGDMVSSVMKAYYDKTGVPIVGVQASRGGEATDYFLNEARKEEMVARYSAAVKYLEESGYTVRKKFMVWCQGESDAEKSRGESSYKTNTRAVFDNVKTAGITDIFMIKTGHRKTGDLDAQYIAVNGWQQDIIDANSDVYGVADLLTDAYKEQMIDNFHYSQAVYNEVGTTVGEAIAEIYKDATTPAEPEEKEVIMPDEPAVEKDKYEITSSDAEINVASLINYGADTYRVYKADKSYEDVKAVKNKLTNPTNGEVTVVPVYRFNYTTAAKEGYVSSTNAYDSGTGYGVVGAACDANGANPVEGKPIRVDLPEGRYDINILRQGGVRANVFNNGIKIITNEGINSGNFQNRTSSDAFEYAPQVLNEGNSMNITIGGANGAVRIATVEIVRVPDKYKKSVVWIAGDSESANFYPNSDDDLDSNKIMITGFGMMLPKLLSSDKYKVANFGEPSATVKTWSNNNLDSVLKSMDTGDTILIDFGINEKVSGSNGITVDEMKAQMKAIIDAAKEKGVTPILVSPVSCGKYQDRAYFRYVNGSNDMYAFANENNIYYIDLNKWTQLYINKAKEETGDNDWIANNYHVADNLHMTQHGALLAASFIAADMKDLGYETTYFAYTYTDISSVDMTEVEGNHGHKRGTETANKRIYSVAAAEKFMSDGTIMKPEITVDGTTVTVTANPEAGDKPVLIHVTRSGGVLETVETHNLTFENNTASVENLSLHNGDELYAWSSLTGMKPLAAKKPVYN